MSDRSTRRRYLKYATLGLTSLAGCQQSRPTQRTPPSSSTPSTTPPHSPSETQTQPVEDVDAVEHDKLIGVQYYPWYWGNAGFGGRFLTAGYEDAWLSATPGEPILGAYDTRNQTVVNQHMRWCLNHGINWWIMTNGQQGGTIDETIQNVVMESPYADQMNFTLLVGLPPSIRNNNGVYDFTNDEAIEELVEWFQHVESEYATDPNYLRLGPENRPALYFWSTSRTTGGMGEAFATARERIDTDLYIIGGPNYNAQPKDIEQYATGFDAVLDYTPYFPRESYLEAFQQQTLKSHKQWRAAAHAYDLEFIPSVIPGWNHQEAPSTFRGGRMLPKLSRDPTRFRELCRALRGFGDHNAFVITSFNEWPEFTAIEPSESWGTTYLEIVREELAEPHWTPPEGPSFTHVTLEFNETIVPANQNPDSTDTRALSFQAQKLQYQTPTGTTELNIGSEESLAFYTNGAYKPEARDSKTWRWFGGTHGPNKQPAYTSIYLPAAPIESLTITGKPVQKGLKANVRINNTLQGTLTFNNGTAQYSLND